jgi:CcmD family protein
MHKKIVAFFLASLSFFTVGMAQTTVNSNNAFDAKAIDALKQDGKIYIVIAVIVIILLGLFFYLWRIDKKLTQLEKQK